MHGRVPEPFPLRQEINRKTDLSMILQVVHYGVVETGKFFASSVDEGVGWFFRKKSGRIQFLGQFQMFSARLHVTAGHQPDAGHGFASENVAVASYCLEIQPIRSTLTKNRVQISGTTE
jgi:hypothetical protein